MTLLALAAMCWLLAGYAAVRWWRSPTRHAHQWQAAWSLPLHQWVQECPCGQTRLTGPPA